MKTIEFVVPLPPMACHPNSRANRWARSSAQRQYRGDVFIAVYEFFEGSLPRLERATISLAFKTKTAHQHDRDNLVAWFKAGLDSLCARKYEVDTSPRLGIIPDDGPEFLTWGNVTQEKGLIPGVVITLTGE